MLAHLANYSTIGAEMLLVAGAMALLMYGVFRPETEKSAEVCTWAALAVIVVAGVLVVQHTGPETLFGNSVVLDPFARFMKVLALVGAGGALVLSIDPLREARILKFEYPVLILLATAGMMMMISANDLIVLYMGLELQSLALYVVAAFHRDNLRSSEAGLKYFVLGALSSGLLLYGASLIYGFTGSTNFAVIAEVAKSTGGVASSANIGLTFGLVFLLVGIAFKISAVPFHMWTPDVYEGAPTPVTAFFASAPKIAAMALLLRVAFGALPGITPQWQQIVIFLSLTSMFLGAFAAIGQTNFKRLMAYSSIANMGYALVGLAAGDATGGQGVLIYLAIYLVMTLGTFACILAMRRPDGPIEDISSLAGLAQTNLPMAASLAVLMFSLAGIPPLAGFFAKVYVFYPAMKAGGVLTYLAILGVISSVIGAYYYLRIVKIMFFDEPEDKFEAVPVRISVIMALSAFLVVAYVAWPGPLVDAAQAAMAGFFPK